MDGVDEVSARTSDLLTANEPQLDRLIAAAAAAVEHDVAFARACLHQARGLLARDVAAAGASSRGGLARWQTRRVIAYVDANLGRQIRVAELATLLHLSTSHFTRAFGQTVGLSPRDFVALRRVVRAQQMMRDSAAPLAQIALECGLCDQSHLTRLFRRIAGVSPRAWRRDAPHADPLPQS